MFFMKDASMAIFATMYMLQNAVNHFQLQLWKEAADTAFGTRNFDVLTLIEARCKNDFTLLEQVSMYKQKLQGGT